MVTTRYPSPVRHSLAIGALVAVCGLPLSAVAQPCDFLNPPPVTDDPDPAGIDSNGDGIDGMACGPIFVSPLGIDSNPGTKDLPMRTIASAAVAAALYSPPRDVYVASWTYTQPVMIKGPVRIFGGFEPATWSRSPVRPLIEANNTAVFIDAGATPATTLLSFMQIHALRTAGVAGSSAVCIAKGNSTGALSLADCDLVADAGVAGAAGTAGVNGLHGNNGTSGSSGTAEGSGGGGGGSGGSSAWGSRGGDGGLGGYNSWGSSGNTGWFGGSNGFTFGGSGGSNASDCFDIGSSGGTGSNGADGGNGANGAGGAASLSGVAGQAGQHGRGGGGGGGGGGGYNGPLCNADRGGGGGGGGGGGQAGTAGGGGQAGGSSVVVLALGGTVASNAATALTSGSGGAGGQGGRGGARGFGGSWGSGGSNGGSSSESGWGGHGGNGGDGGYGGHGGGGGGGFSAGVLRAAGTSSSIAAAITLGAPGAAGAIAPSNGGPVGNAGTAGVAGNDVIAPSATLSSIIGSGRAPTGVQCRIVCIADTPSAPTAALALDPDGDVAASGYTLLATTVPGGTASRPAPNQFVFTPQPGFTGWTSFPIRAIDSGGRTVDGFAVVHVGPAPCAVDANNDGTLTPADIALFVSTWFTSLQQGTLDGDFDGNGAVQPADIATFVGNWAAALTNGC